MAKLSLLALAGFILAMPVTGTAGRAPRVWALKLNDAFTLANSRIGCLVQKHADHGYDFTTLVCFKQSANLSYRPAPYTYVLVADEVGFGVEHLDALAHPTAVFAKPQPLSSGTPRVAHLANPLVAGVAQLQRGDAVYLEGTHIVCIDANQMPTLGCASQGAQGTTRGSYFAALTNGGIEVDRVKSPTDFTPVFQATQ